MKEKPKLFLIDTMALLHRSYYVTADLRTKSGLATGAMYGALQTILFFIKKYDPQNIIACFDLPDKTKRHEAFQDYKAGRSEIDEDLISQMKNIKEIFQVVGFSVQSMPGYEADDLIGTLCEKNQKTFDIFITTVDNDLLQLVKPGISVFLPKKGLRNMKEYNKNDVIEKFGFGPDKIIQYKGMCGDPSDNIKGVAGIGEVGAKKLLEKFDTLEQIYLKIESDREDFEKMGFKKRTTDLLIKSKKDAFFSRDLATIHKNAPISLPKSSCCWKDQTDMKKAEEVFKKYELEKIFSNIKKEFGDTNSDQGQNNKEEIKIYDKKDIKTIQILYWILNSDITEVEIDEVVKEYNSTNLTEIIKTLKQNIKENDLVYIYENIEKPLVDILQKMENIGINIDIKHLKKLETKMKKEIEETEKEIFKISQKVFNVNSTKQMSEVLFVDMGLGKKKIKKTPKGARSTKESALADICDESPIIKFILKHRKTSKLLKTYVLPIQDLVDDKQRLHATFIQNGTTTGRFASKNPNIQNIPIKTKEGNEIRNAFVATKGYSLISFDYNQLELRLAAIMSKDKNLLKILEGNRDIHTETASLMYKTDIKNITKQMRGTAKAINFGILYGMGSRSLAKSMNTSQKEAQEFIKNYNDTFTGLIAFLDDTKRFARMHGYTKTLFGRKRYIRDINSSIPYLVSQAERFAINSPIQGTEADVIKLAMTDIDKYIEKNKDIEIQMLSQIHDELLFEIKNTEENNNEVTKHIKKIKKIMEDVLQKINIDTKLNTSVCFGEKWGMLTEIKK